MNAYLAMRYFWELKMTPLKFWKKLAFEFIHNTLDSGTEEERPEKQNKTRQNTLHKIATAPSHSGFEGVKWVKSTSKSTKSINVTLWDTYILSELCVISQNICSGATHVSLFTL